MELKKEYEIIENFLDEEKSNFIEKILTSNEFPWYYNPELIEDGVGFHFFHHLMHENQITSLFFYKILLPILNNFKGTINTIRRARINCLTQMQIPIYYGFHNDHPEDHKVLLYYVNTNNGFLNLKDGTKIHCKKNKAIIMDGKIKHQVVAQTDTKTRLAINITFN